MSRKNFKGITTVEVTAKLSESVQEAEAYITENSLKFVQAGESCKGTKFDFIGGFNTSDKKFSCTAEELHHTEDNPIILVATKSFKVFSGAPAYVKYIPVENGVIVALLKGYIAVEDNAGNRIPLARNFEGEVGAEGYVYEASDMQNLNVFEDEESDIRYSDHVVSDCIINVELTKDNRIIRGARFSKENFNMMCSKVFEDGKAKKEERLRKQEEERLRKEEERKKFYEEQKKKEEAKRKAEEEKIEAAKSGATAKKKKSGDVITEGATGAQSFLAFVNSLKEKEQA